MKSLQNKSTQKYFFSSLASICFFNIYIPEKEILTHIKNDKSRQTANAGANFVVSFCMSGKKFHYI